MTSLAASVGVNVDLHRLDLHFAHVRVCEPPALERLARSIERCGQLTACIAVTALNGDRFVLIDGYRRVAALRRLGRDTALIERWDCELAQALLQLLARDDARRFAAIEQALLLRELINHFALSQQVIARHCGRDVSWVCRRLQLLSALPDTLVEAVRIGTVSSWAATRVLAPLARANSAHAQHLLGAITAAPLSTRELQLWFTHYQSANRPTRERLVSHPHLFVQSLRTQAQDRADARLRAGPDGECLRTVARLETLITRLRRALPGGAALGTDLRRALARLHTALQGLQDDLRRYTDHDPGADPSQCPHPERPGPLAACDQPPAQALAQHGAADVACGTGAHQR